MRDHRKLRAFGLADALTLEVYRTTARFPKEEQFGLAAQMRRAAVSAASNIVEGCARESEADYARFLSMAYGSCKELEYELSLAKRLGYLSGQHEAELSKQCSDSSKVLNGLIRYLRRRPQKMADTSKRRADGKVAGD